ncbi:MAG: hypothetical protein K6C13_02570, partial [Oscillospiraceae bacterium]|nr:hypothetical protein [Oscillospiraceae bacterium]
KKYIVGNIVLQWVELFMNAVMVALISSTISDLYYGKIEPFNIGFPIIIILVTVIVRFFTAQGATRMSYLASKTVKQKLSELIYSKLLRPGSKYREQVSTAELVQVFVEGVDQLESYFGLYVPQFFMHLSHRSLCLSFWVSEAAGRQRQCCLYVCHLFPVR